MVVTARARSRTSRLPPGSGGSAAPVPAWSAACARRRSGRVSARAISQAGAESSRIAATMARRVRICQRVKDGWAWLRTTYQPAGRLSAKV